jgi:hypothetical protein
MISLKLLHALNYSDVEEIDTLCAWLAAGIVEPAFHDRDGDCIGALKLTTGVDRAPMMLPTTRLRL